MQRYILIAAAVIILLAGGWYFYSNKTGSGMPLQDNQQGSSVGDKISGKLSDLISAGKSMECTFSGETDGYKTTGTMFVSGDNIRGDFQSQSGGKMMDSHMIQSGETVYTWTTDPKQGMKIKVSKEDQVKYADDAGKITNSQSFDMDQSYDYNCKGWSGDQSKFQPPSDIEFQDLSAIMEKTTGLPEKQNNPACSACDSLDDDAKASCRTALNC